MQRWKNFFWISAGILALTAAAGIIAPSAIAQVALVRAALVRDMDSPIRGTRHREIFSINYGLGGSTETLTIAPVIPAGKKLFVQRISMRTVLTDNQSPYEARVTLNPGNIARVWVNQEFQASFGPQGAFTGNQEMATFLNPGEEIEILVRRNGILGSASLNFTQGSINGYLVDASP